MMRRVLSFIILTNVVLSANADNITFTDHAVKELCVAHWDGNGDGELSMEEAAAVTTLGSVFRENTAIGAFPELCYFTGLTAIDDYAFYKSTISGELRIPGNVKTIGDYAFNSCKRLVRVVLEEGVEKVGWHSFSGPIKSLFLPTTITQMSSMAIDPYVNADTSSGLFVPEGDLYVYVNRMEPAAVNDFAFYYVFREAHLVVPVGAVAAYKAASAWSHFAEYLEYGDVNEDGELDISDIVAMNAFIMERNPAPFNKDIADIDADGFIDIADVIGLRRYIMTAAYAPTLTTTSANRNKAHEMTNRSNTAAATLADGLRLSATEVTAAQTTEVEIILDDNAGVYCGLQFDLFLPEGVEIAYDEEEEEYACQPTALTSKYSLDLDRYNKEGGAYYRFLVSHSRNKVIGSGAIYTLTLTASDRISTGELAAAFRNVKLVNAEAQKTEITEIPFTIDAAIDVEMTALGYATFSWPRTLDFTGTGVQAYIATVNEGEYLHLEEVTKVPAATGVILKGSEGTYHPMTTDSEADDTSANLLTGTAAGPYAVESGDHILVLSNLSNGEAGMYVADPGVTIGQYKAFLQVTSAMAGNSLSFDFSPTGITTAHADDDSGEETVYNLAGQRVGSNYQGLVIVNGRKILKR